MNANKLQWTPDVTYTKICGIFTQLTANKTSTGPLSKVHFVEFKDIKKKLHNHFRDV